MVEQQNITNITFTKHPNVKGKIRLFQIIFLLSGLLIWVGQTGFSNKNGHEDLLIKLILIGMLSAILVIFWFSWFARCPQCKTRVYSFSMMWNNKMPMGGNKYCPVCEFPSKEIKQSPGTNVVQSEKQSLLSTIGIAILIGLFIGIFELGVTGFAIRNLLASIVSGIVLVLPISLIRFYYGIQKRYKLFILLILSCVCAVMVWLLIDKSIEFSFLTISVFTFYAHCFHNSYCII